MLRSSIALRKAGDEVEQEPGFFEGDTVAHCGPTLKGEFARTVNLTCVLTGWTWTRSVRNNAHVHILSALKAGYTEVPFEVVGLDFDNGSEFLNHAVIQWAGEQKIFFTRSRPCKMNDQAHRVQGQPPGAQVRLLLQVRHRHRTRRAEPALAAGQRPNELPDSDHRADGLRQRPQRPTQTPLRQAGDLAGPAHPVRDPRSRRQVRELIDYRASLNPAQIGRDIADLQAVLLKLAKEKTEQLYLASSPWPCPTSARASGQGLLTHLSRALLN